MRCIATDLLVVISHCFANVVAMLCKTLLKKADLAAAKVRNHLTPLRACSSELERHPLLLDQNLLACTVASAWLLRR